MGLFIIHYYFQHKDKLKKHLNEIKDLENEKDTLVKRYEHALEGSEVGIWDWDLTSNSIFFDTNWITMLGYEDKEMDLTVKRWKKQIHPDDLKQVLINIYDNYLSIYMSFIFLS